MRSVEVTKTMTLAAAALGMAALTGCGSAKAPSPGHLNAEMMMIAAETDADAKVEMRVGQGGAVEKIAVYQASPTGVPQAVIDRARQSFPDGKVEEYEIELYEDGSRIYEVELDVNGKDCEVASSAKGEMRYVECEVEASEVPKPVMTGMTYVLPGGVLDEAEWIEYADGTKHWTLKVRNAGKVFSVRLDTEGEVLAVYRELEAEIKVPVTPGS